MAEQPQCTLGRKSDIARDHPAWRSQDDHDPAAQDCPTVASSSGGAMLSSPPIGAMPWRRRYAAPCACPTERSFAPSSTC